MTTKIQLVPNLPLRLDVRFCDVVRGEFTIDIKFKGRRAEGGDDVSLFLRHDPTLGALAQAGVLGPLPTYSAETIPTDGIRLNLKVPRLTFVLDQPSPRHKPFVRIGTWSPVSVAGAVVQTSAPASTTTAAGSVERGETQVPPLGHMLVRAERIATGCGPDYLAVMAYVAEIVVPEFHRLHGHAPDDAAIVRMQQSLFIQQSRDR